MEKGENAAVFIDSSYWEWSIELHETGERWLDSYNKFMRGKKAIYC